MELVTARAQQQFEALRAIQQKTERPPIDYRRLPKKDLLDLVELLYERLDDVHRLALHGTAKPAAETAHEALTKAAITGEGMPEAV